VAVKESITKNRIEERFFRTSGKLLGQDGTFSVEIQTLGGPCLMAQYECGALAETY
jgi:hypothetical protein